MSAAVCIVNIVEAAGGGSYIEVFAKYRKLPDASKSADVITIRRRECF